MFTGIIEETGEVQNITRGVKSVRLTIAAKTVTQDTKVGDSICTNGVCLTVTSIDNHRFTADIMPESMRRSSLGSLRNGSKVNLERAISAGQRFGGHIVTGHIDGTGTIISTRKEDNAVWLHIKPPSRLLRYIVEKGSIAIDGVSLTVAAVTENGFSVSIIPHTGAETTLLSLLPDDEVNLECDIIGKYVEKLLTINDANSKICADHGITMDFLAQNGF